MHSELGGQRFGQLTVVERSLHKHYGGNGQAWRCICTCGGWTIRTTSMLLASKRLGQKPMCRACWERLKHKPPHRRGTTNPMGRREALDYAPGLFHEVAERMALLDDLVEAFGAMDEESFTNDQIDPWFTEPR